VDPAAERPEDLRRLDLGANPDKPGGLALRKRADGACVHLGPSGCTVYLHRPRACRVYDCRFSGVAGYIEQFDGGQEAPAWMPEEPTAEDEVFKLALQMGRFEYDGHQRDRRIPAETAYWYAWLTLSRRLLEVRRAVARVDKLGRWVPWLRHTGKQSEGGTHG
jgi:Fe-S-cluster containining protein